MSVILVKLWHKGTGTRIHFTFLWLVPTQVFPPDIMQLLPPSKWPVHEAALALSWRECSRIKELAGVEEC